MVDSSSKPPVTQSSLIILALGLLVGFVIAFVFVLSRLPVDGIISQYNSGEIQEAEMADMNFDYYSVLQNSEQSAPIDPPVVFIEPPVSEPAPVIDTTPLPEIVIPEIIQSEPVQPSITQPSQSRPAIREPVDPPVQPRLEQRPAVQPSDVQPESAPQRQVPAPAQPEVQPRVQPELSPRVQPAPQVQEMLASRPGEDSFYLEAGNYPENQLAISARDNLRTVGIDAFVVVRQESTGAFGHRVRIGPFIEQTRLDDTRSRLRQAGIQPRLIRVKAEQ